MEWHLYTISQRETTLNSLGRQDKINIFRNFTSLTVVYTHHTQWAWSKSRPIALIIVTIIIIIIINIVLSGIEVAQLEIRTTGWFHDILVSYITGVETSKCWHKGHFSGMGDYHLPNKSKTRSPSSLQISWSRFWLAAVSTRTLKGPGRCRSFGKGCLKIVSVRWKETKKQLS